METATAMTSSHFTPRVNGGKVKLPIGMEERGDMVGT